MEMAEDFRPAPEYRDMYKWTKEKIKRVFSDAKGKSGMHYPRHRGLTQAAKWVKPKFTARKWRKMAAWKGKASYPCPDGGKEEISRSFAFHDGNFPDHITHFIK